LKVRSVSPSEPADAAAGYGLILFAVGVYISLRSPHLLRVFLSPVIALLPGNAGAPFKFAGELSPVPAWTVSIFLLVLFVRVIERKTYTSIGLSVPSVPDAVAAVAIAAIDLSLRVAQTYLGQGVNLPKQIDATELPWPANLPPSDAVLVFALAAAFEELGCRAYVIERMQATRRIRTDDLLITNWRPL
jgi:membrane protease YdiL (CAAX protease family)